MEFRQKMELAVKEELDRVTVGGFLMPISRTQKEFLNLRHKKYESMALPNIFSPKSPMR